MTGDVFALYLDSSACQMQALLAFVAQADAIFYGGLAHVAFEHQPIAAHNQQIALIPQA